MSANPVSMSRAYLLGLLLVLQPACKVNDQSPPMATADMTVSSNEHLPPTDLAAAAQTADDLSTTTGPANDLAQGAYMPADSGPGIDVIELVSPAVCRQTNGRLLDCHIAPIVLKAAVASQNAPFMTVLTAQQAGDCSTAYPLELKIQADGDPPVSYNPFNDDRRFTIRRLDRSAISTLIGENSSTWESKAVYHADCRIWVDVALNRHDPY